MLNVTITVITTLLGSITLDIIIINIWSIRHPLWISVAGELRARIIFHSNWHHNEVIAEGLRSLQKLKLLRSVFICSNYQLVIYVCWYVHHLHSQESRREFKIQEFIMSVTIIKCQNVFMKSFTLSESLRFYISDTQLLNFLKPSQLPSSGGKVLRPKNLFHHCDIFSNVL